MKEFIDRIKKRFGPVRYQKVEDRKPKFEMPKAVPEEHRQLFMEQAAAAGVTPKQFGTIVDREQGVSTTPDKVKLVGGVDSTDKGLMQVNKVNEPVVRQWFLKNLGREYNPNSTPDSIIAGSVVLQENRKIFEQMKANRTYTGEITNDDVVNSYNLGPRGIIEQKQGDIFRTNRLNRYVEAGQ